MNAVLDMPRVRVTPETADIFGTRYDVAEIRGVDVREGEPESWRAIATRALVGTATVLALFWLAGAAFEGWWLVAFGCPIGIVVSSVWERYRGHRNTELRVTTRAHGPHTAAWIEDRILAERIADAIERARSRQGVATAQSQQA